MDRVEPEHELIRRVLPLGPLAIVFAFLLALPAGWKAGASSALGMGTVLANFLIHGWSLAWAARLSLSVFYAVAMLGVVVRLGAIIAAMLWLKGFAFFSPLVFLLAAVVGTIALLAFEMRQLQGRLQVELWSLPSRQRGLP